MKKTKLKLTLLGLVVLVALGTVWVIRAQSDVGLWALWFGAFDGLIINYAVANISQKKVIGEHYRQELAE